MWSNASPQCVNPSGTCVRKASKVWSGDHMCIGANEADSSGGGMWISGTAESNYYIGSWKDLGIRIPTINITNHQSKAVEEAGTSARHIGARPSRLNAFEVEK